MNIRNISIACLLSLFAALLSPATIYAHGAEIEYAVSTSIEIEARYDSGEPMSDAQVTVYAPDNPSTPWLTGFCDGEGYFAFTPDPSIPGTWDIRVRQAGHGDMLHIEVEEGSVSGSGSSGYSTIQIVVMSVCVIFGIAGTSLYLKRRKG